MGNTKNNARHRRRPFKAVLGMAATSSMAKQLLLVLAVFVVVFLVALTLKMTVIGRPMTLQDMKMTIVEMLDAQVVIDYTTGDKYLLQHESSGWVLLIVYVLGTVFFSGLLIAAITNIIAGYGDKFKSGELTYHRLSNHIVFLGYDDMVEGILNRMWQRGTFGRRDVVIALQQDVAKFRTRIVSKFPSEYRDKLILVQANLNDEGDMERKLKLHKARKVYILGDDKLEAHDSLNINSFLKICRVAEAKGKMPPCFVSFRHQSSFALFQVFAGASSSSQDERQTDIGLFDRNKQYFHPFNFEEVWVRKVLTSLEGEY